MSKNLRVAEDIHRALVDLALRTMEHEKRCKERLGLKSTHARVLFRLEPGEEITIRMLAERVRLDASNVSTAVAELEANGLLEHRPAPHDRRSRPVALTPAGGRVRAKLVRCLFTDPPSVRGLTPAEQLELRELLKRTQET